MKFNFSISNLAGDKTTLDKLKLSIASSISKYSISLKLLPNLMIKLNMSLIGNLHSNNRLH